MYALVVCCEPSERSAQAYMQVERNRQTSADLPDGKTLTVNAETSSVAAVQAPA
jgi:hypothetical protein